jgi:hypothetical protein
VCEVLIAWCGAGAAKRQGQVGLVQGVYVEVADAAGDPLFTPRGQPDAKPVGAASSPAGGGGGRARVAFEYQAQRDDELDLVFDEVIIVHQRYNVSLQLFSIMAWLTRTAHAARTHTSHTRTHRSDSGWWEGELVATKRRGLFPANYVDMA